MATIQQVVFATDPAEDSVFHYDRGLKLTRADLAIDFQRRQARGFISHAHSDHMGRHELALCTPETAKLYWHRLGGKRAVLDLPYRQPREFGGLRLTTYPAGHCLGSAMLLADDGESSLLYTGDFKLTAPLTCEPAELPHADTLVIESTYGRPDYRLPPRDSAINQLLEIIRETFRAGLTPVIHAYALGKAQEVTRILTLAGFPVLQHADTFAISQIYRECGVDLGDVTPYLGRPTPGHVVVTPPFQHRARRTTGLKQTVTIAVTGWAIDASTKYRQGVDHAVPISDHADYDELFEAVERVGAKKILCTHGPESFVDRLREAGFPAFRLGAQQQMRLFDGSA
ncbi:MAG: hypothetical protein JNM18_25200 [Planctomycetaceae bacterium]|nr:hypothetical protein [Planctomycetaceae bacterium]